jgi:hypothetical protein
MLEPALGHIHNDGVRSMLIEAAERLPAGGAVSRMRQLPMS